MNERKINVKIKENQSITGQINSGKDKGELSICKHIFHPRIKHNSSINQLNKQEMDLLSIGLKHPLPSKMINDTRRVIGIGSAVQTVVLDKQNLISKRDDKIWT